MKNQCDLPGKALTRKMLTPPDGRLIPLRVERRGRIRQLAVFIALLFGVVAGKIVIWGF